MSWKFPRKTQFLTLCDVEKKKIKFLRTRLEACRPSDRHWGRRSRPQQIGALLTSRSDARSEGLTSRSAWPAPLLGSSLRLAPRPSSLHSTLAAPSGKVASADSENRSTDLLLFGKLLYQKPTSSRQAFPSRAALPGCFVPPLSALLRPRGLSPKQRCPLGERPLGGPIGGTLAPSEALSPLLSPKPPKFSVYLPEPAEAAHVERTLIDMLDFILKCIYTIMKRVALRFLGLGPQGRALGFVYN